ncbi:hypothetical protein LMG10661_03343 [Ralstonia syzygii subsp. syzygii]|nr:hypothetical protein LMG10661_03343 [Ralstonia syzygii subsp. syzygii]
MSTEEVSPQDSESTRTLAARNEAEVLRAVARVTQAHAATCMGVSPSTISRDLEHLPRWSQMLAVVGLQVVPTGAMVVDPIEQDAIESMAFKWLESRRFQRMTQAGG